MRHKSLRPLTSGSRDRLPVRGARSSSLVRIAVAVSLWSLATPDPAAAQDLSGRIDAKIRNPGFTIEDNGGGITHAPLDDVSIANAWTDFDGPVLSVDSAIVSSLTGNAIGVGSTVDGTSAVGVGSLRNATGGGYLDYEDAIVIQSATLPAGTPVDVTFSFYAANVTMLSHTAFGESHYGGAENGVGVDYQFSGRISSPGFDTILISNGDNRFLQGEDLLVPGTTTGIMDPATPLFDAVFSTEVGATVTLDFRTFARIGVSVWSSGVGQVEVHQGQAIGAVAIAFGADASNGAVDLQSTLYGGTFPDAAQANLSNAKQVLSVLLPEPEMTEPFVLAALALLARARRSVTTRPPA